MAPWCNAVPLAVSASAVHVAKWAGGQDERVLDLRWESAGSGVVAVTVEESGQAADLYTRTLELGPGVARRLRFVGGLRLSAVCSTAAGTLHWRILDGTERLERRGPGTSVEVPVIGAGATSPVGWCPPYRETVTVYVEHPLVVAYWYNPAGTLVASCPVGVEVPHPPGHQLRVKNGDAVNRAALVTWR